MVENKKKTENKKENLKKIKEENPRKMKEEDTGNAEDVMSFLTPSSPKVIALYDAVRALSQGGADLTQLKVSEIAAKAGIGKGTTYEYFKSREELIVKAVLYNIYQHIQVIERRLERKNGFQQKVYVILDTLFELGGDDKNLFQRLMPFFYDIGSFPVRFREEFKKYAPGMKAVKRIGNALLEDAVEEGIFQEGLEPFYVQAALLTIIVDYAIFRQQSKCQEIRHGLTDEEVRQRLYENLVYALRK